MVVVSSDYQKGGTWAGAEEKLRRDGGRPVFVRTGDDVPRGNTEFASEAGLQATRSGAIQRNISIKRLGAAGASKRSKPGAFIPTNRSEAEPGSPASRRRAEQRRNSIGRLGAAGASNEQLLRKGAKSFPADALTSNLKDALYASMATHKPDEDLKL